MAHQLTENDMMFYLKRDGVPWHGLGTPLDSAPRTAREAVVAAGLNWEVEKRRLHYRIDPPPTVQIVDDDDNLTETPADATPRPVLYAETDHFAVVRKDNNLPVGICKKTFKPLQNLRAFEFFDRITKNEGVDYRVAGSLRGGSVVWALVTLPDFIRIGQERLIPYFLLANSHDGSLAATAMLSLIRTVCDNTLQGALRIAHLNEDSQDFRKLTNGEILPDRERLQKSHILVKLYHAEGILDKFELAEDFLSEVYEEFKMTSEVYELLAETGVTDEGLKWWLNEMEPDPESDLVSNSRRVAARGRLESYYKSGPGAELPTAKGTAWGLYNAAAYYIDHKRGRLKERTKEKRERALHSAWFGSGSRYKQKAFEKALVLAAA